MLGDDRRDPHVDRVRRAEQLGQSESDSESADSDSDSDSDFWIRLGIWTGLGLHMASMRYSVPASSAAALVRPPVGAPAATT